MGADNAEHAGPWQLLFWERQMGLSGWARDIRIQHTATDTTAIQLVDGPWACAGHEFRNEGAFLELTLVQISSGRNVSGTFDMEDGVWAPGDGSGHMTVSEFHREYAAQNTSVTIWPADPFKNVRAPTGLDVRSADGEYFVDLTTNQWRMADWICPVRIVHITTGDVLLDLKTTYWDCRAAFRADGMVELQLRQYPAAGFDLVLELDLKLERYWIKSGEAPALASDGYLDDLQRVLGRAQQDLDEMGILLDVRMSRRGANGLDAGSMPEDEPDTIPLEPLEPEPAVPSAAGPEETLPLAPEAAPQPPVVQASRATPVIEDFDTDPEAIELPARPSPQAVPEPVAVSMPVPPAPSMPVQPPAERATSPAPAGFEGIASVTAIDPEWTAPASAGVSKLKDIIETIEAEITRQRLHAALHYELIILNVIRAAAMGITQPGDTVSMLQTLAKRRNEITGPG